MCDECLMPEQEEEHREHPVRLILSDDLRRSRATVFFRLLLAIPHFIWAALFSVAAFFVLVASWFATLATGRPPAVLHRVLSAYVRYLAHLDAYLLLVADPYPPFAGYTGPVGSYPLDIELPGPAPQSRGKTLFRLFLALPALLLSAALGGGGALGSSRSRGGRSTQLSTGGLGVSVAVLGWFASLATGRMPKGLRDAGAYSIAYNSQALAYLLLVTDRYPDADPTALLAGIDRPPEHPVRLVGDPHDLRRSRATVFFRLLLALPHLVWLVLWAVLMIFVAIANWLATLFRGRPAAPFHRLSARFVRYQLHVSAFLYLVANPFPGFTGLPGTYVLDVELPGPERQNRWKTGFRIVLAVPAWAVGAALGGGLIVCAILTWFVAMARGSAPWGLRNFSAYVLRYNAQSTAYLLLVTDAYPHASPLEGAPTPEHVFDDTP